MGCVSSKRDINDAHPNIFEVMNVNEAGHPVTPGQLELSETKLTLYQRGRSVTIWPLRSLRKYGFDSETFSFECGRRCPTGAGIYAFRCSKAEDLFNMLQHNIQSRNISEEGCPPSVNNEFPIPICSTGPPVNRRIPSQQTQHEGCLNPTTAPLSIRTLPSLSRPGSLSSNGPASPITPPVASPPPDIVLEQNNNKQNNLVQFSEHLYKNTSASKDADNVALPSYINLSSTSAGTICPSENYTNVIADSSCHLYMNVDTNDVKQMSPIPNSNLMNLTKDTPNILSINTTDDILDAKAKQSNFVDFRHCYANLDLPLHSNVPRETITDVMGEEVNYAVLDLVPCRSEHLSLPVTPDSPLKPNESYVIIDFEKTNALSQTVNASIDVEEGSRKTRHNSTISEVTTRNSNSLSD